MLIRDEQIGAFDQPLKARFQQRMRTHLRSRFQVRLADMPDDQITAVIDQATRKARGYGITLEFDVRRFLEYVVEYGPDFDTLDWAWPILVPKGEGTEKMNTLDDTAAFVLRT